MLSTSSAFLLQKILAFELEKPHTIEVGLWVNLPPMMNGTCYFTGSAPGGLALPTDKFHNVSTDQWFNRIQHWAGALDWYDVMCVADCWSYMKYTVVCLIIVLLFSLATGGPSGVRTLLLKQVGKGCGKLERNCLNFSMGRRSVLILSCSHC